MSYRILSPLCYCMSMFSDHGVGLLHPTTSEQRSGSNTTTGMYDDKRFEMHNRTEAIKGGLYRFFLLKSSTFYDIIIPGNAIQESDNGSVLWNNFTESKI